MNATPTLTLPTDQEINAMSTESRQLWQNKKLVHDFFTSVINKRDLTAADTYLTEGYIQRNPGIKTGREGFKAYFTNLFKNFTQTEVHITKMLAEGDEVVTYCEYRFAGRLLKLKMKTIDIWRIEGDRIAEHWDAVEGYGIPDRLLLSLQSQPNKSNSWYELN